MLLKLANGIWAHCPDNSHMSALNGISQVVSSVSHVTFINCLRCLKQTD